MNVENVTLRHDWSPEELDSIYNLPFPELIFKALSIHRATFPAFEVQRSTLLSIKTGGCHEDCSYCPQSKFYRTGVKGHGVLSKEVVLEAAKKAKEEGSTRFCMGAAWREPSEERNDFEKVLELVRGVSSLGLEVCCTLGMLTEEQARRLQEAGCYAYNHNLDTSPEYYPNIISTRTYDERLQTLRNVRNSGMTVCCGGILGMGERVEDRLGLLLQLATQNPHPESVPINALVRVAGTPLEEKPPVDPIEFVRIIATARIIMPRSYVRLSAGRTEMSDEMQALCFLAGANSIFGGEKLLTTPNPEDVSDRELIERLGMSFKAVAAECHPNVG